LISTTQQPEAVQAPAVFEVLLVKRLRSDNLCAVGGRDLCSLEPSGFRGSLVEAQSMAAEFNTFDLGAGEQWAIVARCRK
jgi:hypothetical protein